jgi:hypothetical protein
VRNLSASAFGTSSALSHGAADSRREATANRRLVRATHREGTGMNMDLWYGLRLRELYDLNEATEDLLRDAEEALAPIDATDEDQE